MLSVPGLKPVAALGVWGALGLLFALATVPAVAQATCSHRGALDAQYCDEDKDLVADLPKDPKQFKNPATLMFSYSPVEDPAVYENLFKPFLVYLGQCTRRRVEYFKAQSNASEIEAMRSGRLHVAGFSTGPTNFAVNQAGAVPFAVKGVGNAIRGYHLIVIVKKDSAFQKLTDLKGKRVAHVQATSNSGNLAPRALLPPLGLAPDRDYTVLYSGNHDKSVLGVAAGQYDAAPVASTVFSRMAARGQIREEDFRVLLRSDVFPSTAFAHAHDLEPTLRDTLVKCFFDYRFPAALQSAFDGADRYVPITYLKDWAIVRKVAESSGEKFGSSAFIKMKKEEAQAVPAKAP